MFEQVYSASSCSYVGIYMNNRESRVDFCIVSRSADFHNSLNDYSIFMVLGTYGPLMCQSSEALQVITCV